MATERRSVEKREAAPIVRTWYDPASCRSPSQAIAEAVAAAADIPPTDPEFMLYDHVEPDALNDMVEHIRGETTWEITIEVDGHQVTITSGGWITVR